MKRVARSGVVSEIARISLLALVRVLGLWIGMEAKVGIEPAYTALQAAA
jgi:hypothetical protein